MAIEASDASVLSAIRAALPEGCSLHARFDRGGPYTFGYKAIASRDDIQIPELTARQRDILSLLVEGLSNKEIGRELSLSHFTVRNHVSQIMRLLDASTRREVVARVTGVAFGAIPDAGFAAK